MICPYDHAIDEVIDVFATGWMMKDMTMIKMIKLIYIYI